MVAGGKEPYQSLDDVQRSAEAVRHVTLARGVDERAR